MAGAFTKRFADVSFADVEALVRDKVTESAILDYKESWSSNDDIANLVSAMANTYGGIIVFGVSEIKGTNQPDVIVGITVDDLPNRLDSVCFDVIEPPVICESTYLASEDDTKRVFFVKISPSDITPHAVENGTTVYVKVQAQKRKTTRVEYEKADLGYIRWLEARRSRFEELRGSMIESARDRAKTLKKVLNAYQTEAFLVPKYPRAEVIAYKELLHALQRCQVSINGSQRELKLAAWNYIPIPDGLCYVEEDEIGGVCGQVTAYGLYHSLVSVQGVRNDVHVIYLDNVVRHLVRSFHTGVSLLRQADYVGAIYCGYSIKNISDASVVFAYSDMSTYPFNNFVAHKCKLTDQNAWLREIPASVGTDGVEHVVIDIIDRLLFLFDIGVEEGSYGKALYDSMCSSL